MTDACGNFYMQGVKQGILYTVSNKLILDIVWQLQENNKL